MREATPTFIDAAAWVDSETADPVGRRQRRAVHILLAAIAGIRPAYTLYLKGGLLLGLAHGSPRMTVDIDLTAAFRPAGDIDARIKEELNRILPAAAAGLGYAGTRTVVHKVRKHPPDRNIEEAGFPSLKITVEHASVSGGKTRRDSIPVDISFNEPDVVSVDVFDIGSSIEIHAYSLADVIAEKYRALLQQPRRRRNRRQDVYDIDFLVNRFTFDHAGRAGILEAVLTKCRARGIEPDAGSIDNPEVGRRARDRWDAIRLETGILPEFDRCFEKVRRFWQELPWDRHGKRPAG